MSDYLDFLANKRPTVDYAGFDVSPDSIHEALYAYQREIVRWALRLGKAALFEECGLGKTRQQIEFARLVAHETGGKVIIFAPLAVAHQTIREGAKIGVPVVYCTEQAQVGDAKIVITNYDRLANFDAAQFVGVVLDESSVLKNFTGKTKRALLEAFANTPYKLACTATPAPNDYTELGNHAEFLDVMQQSVMLARWFVNDTQDTGTWTLRPHAAKDFWRWLTSWAVCLSRPSDLGAEYHIEGFDLPPMEIHEVMVAVSQASIDRAQATGLLMPTGSPSSTELHRVKRDSLKERVAAAVAIVEALPADAPYIVWCETNDEADALRKALPDAVEVRGTHKPALKESLLMAFSDGEVRGMITKPEIAGFGLNWQHCATQIFVGVAYSFERFYQAIRRSWRFGQRQAVHAHLIYAASEGNVVATLRAKEAQFADMQLAMNDAMREHGLFRDTRKAPLTETQEDMVIGRNWSLYLGDCVTSLRHIKDQSIDFSIYSPPFVETFVYSDKMADMGNCDSWDEFFTQYDFLSKELLRVTRPGRLIAVHARDLLKLKSRDGVIGLRDFPGALVQAHERTGWNFHSRVVIWKDPVVEMQRTKAHGLLHKNFVNNTTACRQGIADTLLVFRKPQTEDHIPVTQSRELGDYVGTDVLPIAYGEGRSEQSAYSIAVWQRYASPVWFDIDQTRVLNYKQAKANDDSKHICPLQLDVIERAIDLWSNKGDTVLSPFAGIGSEIVCAVKRGRRGVGIELKPEYFKVAAQNAREAEAEADAPMLFDFPDEAEAQAEVS